MLGEGVLAELATHNRAAQRQDKRLAAVTKRVARRVYGKSARALSEERPDLADAPQK